METTFESIFEPSSFDASFGIRSNSTPFLSFSSLAGMDNSGFDSRSSFSSIFDIDAASSTVDGLLSDQPQTDSIDTAVLQSVGSPADSTPSYNPGTPLDVSPINLPQKGDRVDFLSLPPSMTPMPLVVPSNASLNLAGGNAYTDDLLSFDTPEFNLNNKNSNDSMASVTTVASDNIITPRQSSHNLQAGVWSSGGQPMAGRCFSQPLPGQSPLQGYPHLSGRKSQLLSRNPMPFVKENMIEEEEEEDYGIAQPGLLSYGLKGFEEESGLMYRGSKSQQGYSGQDLTQYFVANNAAGLPTHTGYPPSVLLPSAHIAGTAAGWQTTYPTMPSQQTFDNAAQSHYLNLDNFSTEQATYSLVGNPAHNGEEDEVRPLTAPDSASGSFDRGLPLQKSASSDGRRKHSITQPLFSFAPQEHPFDPKARAMPSQLGQRRNVGNMSIDVGKTITPPQTSKGSVRGMAPRASPPPLLYAGPITPTYLPADATEYSFAATGFAPIQVGPTWFSQHPSAIQNSSAQPSAKVTMQTASVMRPAPGNIRVAPDLVEGWQGQTIPKAAKAPKQEPAAPPPLTSAPLIFSDLNSRPIASLPTPKRKAASPSNRPKPAKPAKRSRAAAEPFSAFVNFTAADADKLLTGVAPSGSQKRKRDQSSQEAPESFKKAKV